MVIESKYDASQQLVLTRIVGNISLTEILSYQDELINNVLLNKPFIEIIDLSETTTFDFGYKQTKQMIDKLAQLTSMGNYKGTSFIASRDYTRGMSNIFKMVGEVSSINIKIFTCLEDALTDVNNRLPTAGFIADRAESRTLIGPESGKVE